MTEIGNRPDEALESALANGDEQGILAALGQGASLAPRGEWSPLRKALDLCRKRDAQAPRILAMLLGLGADPEARFEHPLPGYSSSPAIYACGLLGRAATSPSQERDDRLVKCVGLLAEAGAVMPGSVYAVLVSPLLSKTEALRSLSICANSASAPKPGIGDFLRAMETGKEFLETLAWAWPSSDAADHRGNTPLHYAAMAGHDTACRILLDAGANIDTPNRDGETPLLCACGQRGTDAAVRLLLLYGADPQLRSHSGVSPLEAAFGMKNGAGVAKCRLLESVLASADSE